MINRRHSTIYKCSLISRYLQQVTNNRYVLSNLAKHKSILLRETVTTTKTLRDLFIPGFVTQRANKSERVNKLYGFGVFTCLHRIGLGLGFKMHQLTILTNLSLCWLSIFRQLKIVFTTGLSPLEIAKSTTLLTVTGHNFVSWSVFSNFSVPSLRSLLRAKKDLGASSECLRSSHLSSSLF